MADSHDDIRVTGAPGGKPLATIRPTDPFNPSPQVRFGDTLSQIQEFSDGFKGSQFNSLYSGLDDPAQFDAVLGGTLGAFQNRIGNIDTALGNVDAFRNATLNDPDFLAYQEGVRNRATPGFETITDAMLAQERDSIAAGVSAQLSAGSAGLRRRGFTDSGLQESLSNQARLAGAGQLSSLSARQQVANTGFQIEAEKSLGVIAEYKKGIESGVLTETNRLQLLREIAPETMYDLLAGARTIEDADRIADMIQDEFDLSTNELALMDELTQAFIADIEGNLFSNIGDTILAIIGTGTDFGPAAVGGAALGLFENLGNN